MWVRHFCSAPQSCGCFSLHPQTTFPRIDAGNVRCKTHCSLFNRVASSPLACPGSISYSSLATAMPIATTPTPQPLVSTTLPPPQTFDFLPPLHALLSRLLLPRDSIDPSSPSSDTLTPISPKELGAAASAITNKIQKARVIVKELPGTDMSVQQQEIAINELESEVKRLESRIEDVREKARTWVGAGSGTLGGKGDEEAMEE